MTSDKLFEKIENCNSLDFGGIFNKSIELFKKVWLQGFVHLLISFLVMLPLIFVMYIPIIALAGVSSGYGHGYPSEEVSIGLMILFVILVFIVSIVASAFQFGITAHFYKVCKEVDLGLPETSSYFVFLKGRNLRKVLLLSLVTFGIALLAIALCYFPLFYVIVPLQLLGVLFAFNPEIEVSDLIKASFKLGNKKWLLVFGLVWVSSMLATMVGFIMCFVGVFFTSSFALLPVYFVYKDAIGFEEEELENENTFLIK
ncbi:hypothetical protein [Aquimarina muelleri]|uniref:Glycerophosphoryl diester phosphodiesterase membrane domain-containing protein n=1 Tax=Aquimarina muelleri TaxID=279356 RepID=A0A918JX56_9FLAO|nr:hypothetical protein [Aquimarina muelleri]MCX2763627.1 hypothetical protein [Aquimarina muelleri]GGX26673.1 hypothetical protein GCM10007384_29750 [Aquimarina muelleri]